MTMRRAKLSFCYQGSICAVRGSGHYMMYDLIQVRSVGEINKADQKRGVASGACNKQMH